MTAWPDGALRSPSTGRVLRQDSPHSLAAGSERWPVIDDIPFLRADRADLAAETLHALDAGASEEALVLLLSDQDGWASTPPPGVAARQRLVRSRDALSFREAMDALAFGPVATYFAHRWSDPTFLSGLALAEAFWTEPARVFELACGAGHFLGRFASAGPVVSGGDLVYAKLWLARHYVAPAARLVCFDAARPWPIADASADVVFCHDAFYFLPDKPHVAGEMRRAAGAEGTILVGHAHNALVDNLSHGAPLTPAGYASLFASPTLFDDREMTQALIEARAPRPRTADELTSAPAITLADAAIAPRPVVAGLAMPAAGAPLTRNPLYAPLDGRIARRFPSDRYAAEYGALATYPAETGAAETAIAGASPEVDRLARLRVFVELPPRW